MGLLSWGRDVWYGPAQGSVPSALPDDNRHDWVFSGVVTVTDVQEALELAEGIFKSEAATHAPPGATVVVRSHSGTGNTRYGVKVSDLAGAEWENVTFEVGFASEIENPPDEWNRYQWHDTMRLSLNEYEAALMSSPNRDEMMGTRVGESTSERAHAAALKALLSGVRRRTPPARRKQAAAGSAPAVLGGLWLWAMLAAEPPLAVWLFSAVLTVLVGASLFRLLAPPIPQGSLGPHHPGANGRLMVDLTPREKMLATRASGHRDAKVVAVTVAGTLLAGVLTAYFTGLWTPGAGS
ncbi:hypothetical protein [Cellulosimicrobium sp. CpK407]|uniref:hypothetical protein n=1 Tax=Cellulosimicrobium sp. CpK407 TaxID=3229847 RepID=UPI003F2B51BA